MVRKAAPAVLFAAAVAAVAALSMTPTIAGEKDPAPLPELEGGQAEAVFAGGCFWCMESPFDKLDGVSSTTSGYIGGEVDNPTYGQVSAGGTGHAEAVRVVYDPSKVSYEKLLSVFWHNVDPFDERGQFCDKGDQYRSAVFVATPEERAAAKASVKAVAEELAAKFPGREIATTIEDSARFWPAEVYHQDYKAKNPVRYQYYRLGCGRDNRLVDVWGEKAGK